MRRDPAQRPDWTDFKRSDPGTTLLELLGYAADFLAHYQDKAAEEARLGTRRRYVLVLGAVLVALAFWWRRADGSDDQ